MTTAAAPAQIPAAVTAEDRFLFDLQGFVLLRGVLSAEERAALLRVVRRLEATDFEDDAWRSRLRPGNAERAMPTKHAFSGVRLNGLLRLDPAFDRLIDHPRVTPLLHAFMHRPQLGNTWSISKSAGGGVNGWHRGATPMDYWVREGQIRSRMVNVVWMLTDNDREDGCMCVLPGSHKSSFAKLGAYEDVQALEGGAQFDYAAHDGLALPGSVAVTGSAGDVLVLSESVIHGGLRKTTPGVRTNLYFNHLAALSFSNLLDTSHMRHAWLPDRLRERFAPGQREMTAWMEYARYELDE